MTVCSFVLHNSRESFGGKEKYDGFNKFGYYQCFVPSKLAWLS